MLTHFIIGGVLIAATVALQAFCFDLIMRFSKRLSAWFSSHVPFYWKAFFVSAVVLAVMAVGVVHMWLWALAYLAVGALADLDTALYFSVVSFTTVGYGDVLLAPNWRILGSIEAANGFLLFGWSAAFIFDIVSNTYRQEARAIENKPE